MLQDLIPVELRQVAAEAHQDLIEGQQFLVVVGLLVFHYVSEDGRQPEEAEAVQLAYAGLQKRRRAAEKLQALLGTQRMVSEKLMTFSQFLFYYCQALLQFCIKARVLFFQIQQHFWPILFLILFYKVTNKWMQVLELISNDFLIGVLTGLSAENDSCFNDLDNQINPMGDPEGLFDGLLVEAWKLALLKIFEEILDGLAEGVLIDLAEEWPLDIGFDVSKVLLAVLSVDLGDVLDGLGGISGSFGDFGVIDDIGIDQQNGKVLFEFLIVLGRVCIVGDTLTIGACLQTTTVVGQFVFDHTQLQQLHLESRTAHIHPHFFR